MTWQSDDGGGWPVIRLGDVCRIDARQVDPRLPEYGKMPHISGENIAIGVGRILNVKSAFQDGMTSPKYLFESGDVLYSKLRPYLRKVTLVDFPGVCSADMYPLKVNREILDSTFTKWLLLSENFTEYAIEESRRARMPKLNRDQLFSFRFPLPPMAEQVRIGLILESQMLSVERARSAAEGQLEAASSLAIAQLHAVFRDGMTAAWPSKPLGEVGEIVSGVTLGRKLNDKTTRAIPYLRVANVKDGFLDLSDIYSTEATDSERDKLLLVHGDLLLTEGGDADKLGRGTFWENQLPECIHQNHIFRIRFNLDKYDPRFLSAQLGSPYGKSYFLAHAKQTTGIATINRRVLAAFPLLSPPIEEQRTIANRIDTMSGHAARLTQAALEQRNAIDQLPAALLRRAFNGEL